MNRESLLQVLLQDPSFTFSGLEDMFFNMTKEPSLYNRRLTITFLYKHRTSCYSFSVIKGVHVLYLCIDVLADIVLSEKRT
jgi:hypothetical protein